MRPIYILHEGKSKNDDNKLFELLVRQLSRRV